MGDARGRRAWLICYDITNDRRRTRVFKLLRRYGDHLQYSVFRVVQTPVRLTYLRASLNELIEPSEDSVLLVLLGDPEGGSNIETLGRPLAEEPRVRIVD